MHGGEEIFWPVEWSQDGVVRLTERIQPGAVTPHAFGRDLAFLTRTLSPSNSKMTALTSGDEQRFLDHRTAKKLAPKTINVDVKIIRGALNAARCQGLVPPNPAEAVSMERGTFTPAEVKLLVDTAAGEWKLLILLAYFTGARLSDFARMQWEG